MLFKSTLKAEHFVKSKLSKTLNSVVFRDLRTKEVLETQTLFDKVKNTPTFHGAPIPEAIMGFYRNKSGHNTTFIRTAENVIERGVLKDVEKGFAQVDYALYTHDNGVKKMVGFKRKLHDFDTNGKRFTKHNQTVEINFINTDMKGFSVPLETDKKKVLVIALPQKEFPQDKQGITNIFEEHFAQTVSTILKPVSQLRKGLLQEWTTKKVTSLLNHELEKELPLTPYLKKTENIARTAVLKLDSGEVKETHNIFFNPATHFHGIPMPESIMMFMSTKPNRTGILLKDNSVIHRDIFRDFEKGVTTTLYTLSKNINGAMEPVSFMLKKAKFEVQKGQLTKLISKGRLTFDHEGHKGFRYYMNKLGKFDDTRGLPRETNAYNVTKELILKTKNTKSRALFEKLAKDLGESNLGKGVS